MKLILVALSLLTGAVLAHPSREERAAVQIAHLTFHGGPASYQLSVPADGTVVPTNSDISINIIDAPDYNAIPQCKFKTDGQQTLVLGIDTTTGNQQVIVGPPQPIRSVSCTGKCVPIYSDCYVNGQPVGPCCNGFCAANKCRPWNISTG